MSKANISSIPIRSRRAVLSGLAVTAALPIAAAVPAAAAHTIDAELLELGSRFEPLVDRYYVARKRWAPLLTSAHAEHHREFGTEWSPESSAALHASCERFGVDAASEELSAVYEEMEPLAEAINASPVNSIEGLRAKALVALWEVAPLGAAETEFSFDDAYPFQQLFTAVAELCGLKDKMLATGHKLPDIDNGDDDADEGEEA